MNACQAFRSHLEEALVGLREQRPLEALTWHEHLVQCSACRELLAGEQALELLLASLPEPRLEPDVAQRILARLREVRTGDRLDALLDLDLAQAAPPGLASRVLSRLAQTGEPASTRDARLDRLLARAWANAQDDMPEDLPARLLSRLSLARRTPRSAPALPWILLRLAAALVLAVSAGFLLSRAWRKDNSAKNTLALHTGDDSREQAAEHTQPETASTSAQAHISDEFLASLDVLQSWEALEAAGASETDDIGELDLQDLLVLELLAEADFGLAPLEREDER